ncbi:MAG: Gfo/Idh/MocA family oxidoreductase [Hyphomonadaceae bacterium]|nr:Gfo/Idh/MocA family oxidoreductase [Hyphomonadaceae bacterium]
MSAPLNLGIVGLGRGFVLTAPSLRAHPEIRLVAAADLRPEARAAFAAEFNAAAYPESDALFADANVNAVYIAAPTATHASLAIAAARAGKHVLVDKPMALSSAECRTMIDAAKAAGVKLVVGPSHASDAPIAHAADIIAGGVFGAPRFITALNATDFIYRPRRPNELAEEGALVSQAPHHIDIVRRLANADIASVRAVAGDWDRARPATGAYAAFISFANGVAATLTYSGYAHYDADELMENVSELGFPKSAAHGAARRALQRQTELDAKERRGFGGPDARSLEAPPHHEHFGFLLVQCERGDLRLTPDGVWIYADDERRFQALQPPIAGRFAAIDAFVQAVRGRSDPLFDGVWGLHTLLACEAMARSSREAREITLPGPC